MLSSLKVTRASWPAVCPGARAQVPKAALLGLQEGLAAPLQVRWKRGKRKKNPKMADRTPEQLAASGGFRGNRLEDYHMETQSPYQLSLQIRKHLRGLSSDGRHNTRRKKDLARYTNYRVLRVAGLTHDTQQDDADRKGFVTPLTRLQHESNLPRSANHRRLTVPHTFSYKVYWGPPSVEEEPNAYEGSMVGCSVAVRLKDLPLTQREKERLIDIVGVERIDEATGVMALEADIFPERNHNAAILGDMLEQLLREVKAMPTDVEYQE